MFNIDVEVVGVYDVGVFYIKKKIRFNFFLLVKIFILLFENLVFDCLLDVNDIKEFVKK